MKCNNLAVAGSYSVGTICAFSCGPKYTLLPNVTTATCQSDSMWNVAESPSCVASCSPIALSSDLQVCNGPRLTDNVSGGLY